MRCLLQLQLNPFIISFFPRSALCFGGDDDDVRGWRTDEGFFFFFFLTSTTGIKEYSDWPTIPQLYVNKEFIGGSDILMSMHQNGELAKLLEENGVVVTDAAEEGGEKS